jgi:hypothetical protein
MVSKTFLILGVAAGLAGCAAQAQPPSADSTTSAALTVTDGEEAFVGTWTFEAGSQVTIACPGAAVAQLVQPLAGTQLVLSAGDDGLIHAVNGVGCHYRYAMDKNKDEASLVRGQTCEVPDGRGGTATEHLEHDVITLAADGLKVNANGTLDACALTVTGTLTR